MVKSYQNSNILSVNKFFEFSEVNVVGYKSELKNIPPGIYYFNISAAGSVAINETFVDQAHRDPEWHDYGIKHIEIRNGMITEKLVMVLCLFLVVILIPTIF